MIEKPRTPDGAVQLASLIFAAVLVDPEGRIVEVNPAAEEMLGRSLARIVGKPVRDSIAVTEKRVVAAMDARDVRMIARGVVIGTAQGSREVNMSASPVTGYPGWQVLTLSDAGQEPEEDDERAEVELRTPAVLAHEIKNPLAAIRGASQLLQRRLGETDKPLATMIAGEVDRIAQLIDRMQQLGSRNVTKAAACNLHAAIRSAMATVRASRSDGPALEEEFDPSLPSVLADSGALEQVLINLLANACDASPEDGSVTVTTRYVSGMSFSALRLGKAVKLPVEITVTDQGAGIDPALRDHVFEPFVSGKPRGQGLGLALVRKLVRDMGGRVTHLRDDRAGLTHFRINLAIAPQEKERAA